MKIIFLDFDGVLNRGDEPNTCLRQLSPSCVKILNTLIERTNAKIVITSVWRILRTTAELRQIMVHYGFRFPGNVIDKTPRNGGRRGTEIEEWLRSYSIAGWSGEVEKIVIIDDDSDMEPFMDRLVQTDSDTGITIEDVEKVVALLVETSLLKEEDYGRGKRNALCHPV